MLGGKFMENQKINKNCKISSCGWDSYMLGGKFVENQKINKNCKISSCGWDSFLHVRRKVRGKPKNQ